MKTWQGWIVANKNDINLLESLGVKIKGVKDQALMTAEYIIECDDETLQKLDPYWGRFIWGLN